MKKTNGFSGRLLLSGICATAICNLATEAQAASNNNAMAATSTAATAAARSQSLRAVKTRHASRVKANGAIHKTLKSKTVRTLSVLSASATNSSVSVNPDKSLLAPFGVLFAQVAKDQLILTVDETGAFQPFFYVNDYVGYANPVTGDLLYCADYKPRDQFLTLSATDCQIDGSIYDISQYDKYSNGQYVRSSDGNTLYYDNGAVVKDYYGNWFYSDGVTKVYDYYYKNLNYSNGSKAYDAYYGNFYHPTGATLFDNYYNEMRFSSGAVFTDADVGFAYYQNGADLRRFYLDTNNKYTTYFKYPNQTNLANFKSDGRADIFYPLGTTLKHDVNVFDGDIFYENGVQANSFVNYEYELPFNYGYVDVDADHVSDVMATTLTDGNTYFFAINSRIKPALPPKVSNFTNSALHVKDLGFSWDSGGGSTDSFLISIKNGNVSNANCAGGNSLNSATRTYTWGNLAPNTTYTVAICALNSIGDRSLSSILTVTTAAIVYPPMPVSLKTSKVLSNRIGLEWASGGGNTSGYRYVIAEGSSVLPDCANGTATNATSVSLGSLKPQTTYTVGVCASESNGYTSGAAKITVKTGAVVVPPVVTNLASVSTLNSLDLSWKSGGANTSYYVIARRKGYGDVNCKSPAALAAISTSTTPAVEVKNLKAASRFTFAICAAAEDGTLSAPVTIKASTFTAATLPLPPAATNLTGVRSGKNIVVNWKSGGGSTAGFIWNVANKGTSASLSCKGANTIKLGNVTSRTIKNAKANKPYIIALCAVNQAGKIGDATKVRVEIK